MIVSPAMSVAPLQSTGLSTALNYVRSGLSVVPIQANGSKASAVPWKDFQSTIATEETLNSWFCGSTAYGIAIVAGKVSGNLEILDFDQPEKFVEWLDCLQLLGATPLLANLPIVRTPSGVHVYYRSEKVEPNQKLAQRKRAKGIECLIETRGEGGYVIAPGSPAACHPSGVPYCLESGDLTQIPTITAEDRDLLLTTARSLTEYAPDRDVQRLPKQGLPVRTDEGPIEAYNRDAVANELTEQLLSNNGWTRMSSSGESSQWRKPGSASSGIHATLHKVAPGVLYVFSTAAAPFEAGNAYSPFVIYGLLEHNGDFRAAFKEVQRKYVHEFIEWNEPELLTADLQPVIKFTEDMLPQPLSEYVADVSHRMQCPMDYVAAALIVTIGAVVGAGCAVRPKQKDDWTVIPNLYGGAVGPPGVLKTPALAEPLKFLARLELQATAAYEQSLSEHEIELQVHEATRSALREQIKAAAKDGSEDLETLKRGLLALKPPPEPHRRRFRTNDATVEKLSELLQHNSRGILVFRDELIGQLAAWDRDGREQDRAFYLEAWNGFGSFTVDRIGRGTVHVENLCVSLFGGIQPSKLSSYLHQAVSGKHNDGLVQRLQLLVYPDLPTEWTLVDDYPNGIARDRIFNLMETLASVDFVQIGAFTDDSGVPYFRFEDDAQDLFFRWLTKLQTKKLPSIEDPIIAEHLSKYRSLLPSLALLFHLVSLADNNTTGSISLHATELAIRWCNYLESHARRVYGMVLDRGKQAAGYLAKKIRSGALRSEFTARDVYRKQWTHLSEPEIASEACEMLVDAGWLHPLHEGSSRGGRSTIKYLINPKLEATTRHD